MAACKQYQESLLFCELQIWVLPYRAISQIHDLEKRETSTTLSTSKRPQIFIDMFAKKSRWVMRLHVVGDFFGLRLHPVVFSLCILLQTFNFCPFPMFTHCLRCVVERVFACRRRFGILILGILMLDARTQKTQITIKLIHMPSTLISLVQDLHETSHVTLGSYMKAGILPREMGREFHILVFQLFSCC